MSQFERQRLFHNRDTGGLFPMNNPVVIILTNTQYQDTVDIGSARSIPKREADIDPNEWGPRTALEGDIMGVGAELVCEIYTDGSMCRESALDGVKGHHDVVDGNFTYEVKCISKRHYRLVMMVDEETKEPMFHGDIGVLIHRREDKRTFEIVGVISKKQFMHKYHIENLGFGPRAVVEHHHLAHPSVLKDRELREQLMRVMRRK